MRPRTGARCDHVPRHDATARQGTHIRALRKVLQVKLPAHVLWIGAALAAWVITAAPCAAQSMPGMSAGTGGPSAASPSSQAYGDAMMKMHRAMDVPLSGNPDRDFVTGMIAHHQGAIDMAQVELRYGKDAQMRRLAQHIITAQEKEITAMRAWLAKHPG